MRRREKLFWLCAGAALIILFVSLIPGHHPICEVAEQAKEENCPAYRVLPFLVIKVGKILDDHNGAVTAVFTIVLAISTIGLWAATRRLWVAGERQFRHARASALAQSRATQASLAASVEAAKAATRSAAVAENALIATDRAWISIKAKVTRPLTFKDDQINLGVDFEIVNVGNAPATDVQLFAELCRDITKAKLKGMEMANLVSSSILNIGIVLFPKETEVQETRRLRTSLRDFKAIISTMNSEQNPTTTEYPAVMACATYKLAGSPEVRRTIILFEVTHSDPAHLGWDGSEGETDPAYLRLVQTYMSGQVT